MRRTIPATLRRRQLLVPFPSIYIKPAIFEPRHTFTTSTALALPRHKPERLISLSNAGDGAESSTWVSVPEDAAEDDSAVSNPDGASPPSDEVPPDKSTTLAEAAFTVSSPTPTDTALPEHLLPISDHISTSFLPSYQHHLPRQPTMTKKISAFTIIGGVPQEVVHTEPPENDDKREAIVALVTPFEGGERYIYDSVKTIASKLDADVIRLDLALGVGFEGSASPLSPLVKSSPSIPVNVNPLLQTSLSSRPTPAQTDSEMEEEDEEDEEMQGKMGIMRVPLIGMAGPGLQGMMTSSSNSSAPPTVIDDDWVLFFSQLINTSAPAPPSSTPRKRIILLESATAMSGTFDVWFPSLCEAVRQRRRALLPPMPKTKIAAAKAKETKLDLQPTTIVLSCTPSLLLPHTGDIIGSPLPATESHSDHPLSSVRSAVEALAEKFSAMGMGVSVEGPKEGDDRSKLWWGSHEEDEGGRAQREKKRLQALLQDGKAPMNCLPTFGPRLSGPAEKPQSGNPILDMLAAQAGRQPPEPTTSAAPFVWKALTIIPPNRDVSRERNERITRRRLVNATLISKAISDAGGTLLDPLTVLSMGKGRMTKKSSKRSLDWEGTVLSWEQIQELASLALGNKVSGNEGTTVSWADIVRARTAKAEYGKRLRKRIEEFLPSKETANIASEKLDDAPKPPLDPVVEAIKKSKNLTQHERRLLPCIVDPTKLASTSFKDVHLPFKTIDGIRTLVSLPLLFPEAFLGGILKDHSTGGALLFGPPGTGKTILARAVASESGARMLAIQPSDVNDMYVGEGEKMVKAVFSLARRLSPCVIFLDELDSLASARSARDSSGGSKAHNQVLTEFMQEMDGLSSAIANKDKRLVVIGATNRPFDLDDAILRRLPRRLLIDLPNQKDRKAILQILLRGESLESDVDLDQLSKDTDGFSGSDLKHLCVSAALAAVKDMVEVPWREQTSSSATTIQPNPAAGGSSSPQSQPTELLLVSQGSGRRRAKVSAPQAVLRGDIAQKTAIRETDPSDITSSTVPIRETIQQTEEDVVVLDKDETLLSPKTSPEEEDLPEKPLMPAQRILGNKHFKIALSEIRPSATEDGTLPELRKWAEQFGEGGSRKGKKSGFGKGFGFGDPIKAPGDSGYGKVSQED